MEYYGQTEESRGKEYEFKSMEQGKYEDTEDFLSRMKVGLDERREQPSEGIQREEEDRDWTLISVRAGAESASFDSALENIENEKAKDVAEKRANKSVLPFNWLDNDKKLLESRDNAISDRREHSEGKLDGKKQVTDRDTHYFIHRYDTYFSEDSSIYKDNISKVKLSMIIDQRDERFDKAKSDERKNDHQRGSRNHDNYLDDIGDLSPAIRGCEQGRSNGMGIE